MRRLLVFLDGARGPLALLLLAAVLGVALGLAASFALGMF